MSLYTRAKLWPWMVILKIIGVLFVIVAAVWVFYRIFILPGQLAQEAAQAKQDTRAAQGEANLARDVTNTMEGRVEYHNTVHEITRENTREILSAQGASDRIPPAVHDAGLNAIGMLRNAAAADQHNDQAD